MLQEEVRDSNPYEESFRTSNWRCNGLPALWVRDRHRQGQKSGTPTYQPSGLVNAGALIARKCW